MKRLKPSPALVISLIALFVALGSGAYAASQIRTKDIRDEAVTGKKLAKNAVKSNKTKDGGIKGKDLLDATVTSEKLALVETSRREATVADNSSLALSVDCPDGFRAISGEGFVSDQFPPAGVSVTAMVNLGDAWRVIVRNDSGSSERVGVTALCIEE